MPSITCDIRVGRTKERKSQLAMSLTKVVQEATDLGIDHIFLVMSECLASTSWTAANTSQTTSRSGRPVSSRTRADSPVQTEPHLDTPFVQCELEQGLSDTETRSVFAK